ncbi:Arm DNA-binding domain-containing protein [Vibrio cholerae]
MTTKQVASLAKSREPTRKSNGKGLYFVVPDSGAPYWALRYSGNGKRKQMTLAQYPSMSLADARSEADVFKREYIGRRLRTYPKRDLFQTMGPQAKCNMAS